MKKVLVLAILATLVSTSAFAITAISTSKHNLASSASRSLKGNVDEICVYCHTPHAASATGASFKAPLWNRSTTLSGGTLTQKYTSNTLSAIATTAAALNTSDAILCLSCHDGASLTINLVNNPNSMGGTQVTIATGSLSAEANIGANLTNDHPVGFNYATAVGQDSGLNTALSATQVTATVPLFNGDVWCSSCHDVHDNTNSPFLVQPNTGSALCLACHNK